MNAGTVLAASKRFRSLTQPRRSSTHLRPAAFTVACVSEVGPAPTSSATDNCDDNVDVVLTETTDDICCPTALDFDDNGDYIDTNQRLDVGGLEFTMEMWIKTTDTGRGILIGNYGNNPLREL